jgi:hypothetical protein
MAERFSLPDKWFEYSVVEGVDEGKPGIYYWLIEGGDSYIGKYSSIDRPTKHYGRIVERSINLKPYRKSNPEGFRRVHIALRKAVEEERRIELRILKNADPAEINARERELIRELRPTLNGLSAS